MSHANMMPNPNFYANRNTMPNPNFNANVNRAPAPATHDFMQPGTYTNPGPVQTHLGGPMPVSNGNRAAQPRGNPPTGGGPLPNCGRNPTHPQGGPNPTPPQRGVILPPWSRDVNQKPHFAHYK